ncbi:hypothetical protein [Crassaminicella indica]|uniref:N-acetyltransferase domain-containing protein n=1 Tax=Crassaminicella indica TaxID=2855394 RepID=A0ABX8R9R8_9CLOT|nr:hypothetical protein [Crassaminicella indica]QXM05789.1 hypothetical protein KVH43_10530 [Crassaminicella indica]
MINIYNIKTIRKTVPIYKKIDPIQLMNWIKTFSRICNLKFTCQIITKNSDNKWLFQYKANKEIYITLCFCDMNNDPYPYIIIDDFIFPKKYREDLLDKKILKTIIQHVKNLDFEILIFNIKEYHQIELCKKNGFKKMNIHKMTMSLKPKFIHTYKTYNT